MNLFKKIINKKLILKILIMIAIPTVSLGRYYEKIENISGKGIIAEPIFIVENLQDTIHQEINKNSIVDTYTFVIKNYKIDEKDGSQRISEVDMEYQIEIINENTNFPINYKLFEIEAEENLLKEANKTEKITIKANQEYEKKYKLQVYWEDKNETLSNESSVKILINSNQIKEE